ncbi:hypothetical protein ColLi_12635 [Colletotrichum liriopes]|uniref:Uncharacterized protein n=1 Tax=Colletotrichum liriopes TaxID=708192 RepID=A0AA37GZA3_9PEZI|nr:hypothetical protein ColLi_12635 [Colletotrichum liriopes]
MGSTQASLTTGPSSPYTGSLANHATPPIASTLASSPSSHSTYPSGTPRITPNHLEPLTVVLQQAVSNSGGNHHDVALLDHGLDAPLVALAPETQPRASAADAQHLVRRAVEVAGAVHGVPPLRLDDPDRGEVRFDGGRAGGEEGGVVDQKRFVLDARIWEQAMRWDQVP